MQVNFIVPNGKAVALVINNLKIKIYEISRTNNKGKNK